jgi:hypothetical protein
MKTHPRQRFVSPEERTERLATGMKAVPLSLEYNRCCIDHRENQSHELRFSTTERTGS